MGGFELLLGFFLAVKLAYEGVIALDGVLKHR